MANNTLSQSVSNFRMMASGINTRLDSLASVGVTADDVATMNNFADSLDQLNAEQEELKARLKAKTEQLYAMEKAAKAKNSELSKRVKIVIPQSEWVAFGIMAKR